jgi:hypothetical protein
LPGLGETPKEGRKKAETRRPKAEWRLVQRVADGLVEGLASVLTILKLPKRGKASHVGHVAQSRIAGSLVLPLCK